nr:hypothetical protein TEA_028934 [Ipomoea batatas]GMD99238.1 hypothetical protein TEA_028934 [Ipomoea batatas]
MESVRRASMREATARVRTCEEGQEADCRERLAAGVVAVLAEVNDGSIDGEFELAIKVEPELDRAKQPHSPSSPGLSLDVEHDVALAQRGLGGVGLLGREGDGGGLDGVVEIEGAVLGDVEVVGDQVGDLDAVEAEGVVRVVEAGVGLGVAVLRLDHNGGLHGQDAGHVVRDPLELGARDAHLRHLRLHHHVADEHRDTCEDHGKS